MIFILTEQVFNGTVTMSVIPTGVEADSFKEAVNKIKDKLKSIPHEIKRDDDDVFRYSTEGDFPLVGYVTKKPLEIL